MRPGILGIFDTDPELAVLLSSLAQCLMRRESTIAPGDRELVATYVSGLNQTRFCWQSHGHVAFGYGVDELLVRCCQQGLVPEETPDRVKAMLAIAKAINAMTPLPATELTEGEVFEVACIAAAFALFNRLVMLNPTEPIEGYVEIARQLIDFGYLQSA